MRKKNKILFAAENLGGFNAIAPVIKKLSKQNVDFKVILASESCEAAKRDDIDFLDGTDRSQKNLENILDSFGPDIAVLGTSHGLSLEKKVISWTKRRGIISVAMLDFWCDYRMRFSTPGTDDLAYLPDYICVIDENMEKQMISSGFDKSRLRITGNPFFDTLKGLKSEQDDGYILFIAPYFSELGNKANKSAGSPIFDGAKIFTDYVNILEKIKDTSPILIRMHPHCKKKDGLVAVISRSKLKISIAETGENILDLVGRAKLIIGIHSMVLFQAAMMGKKVLSYQPGISEKEDPLPSNQLGISRVAYSYDQLEKQIIEALNQPAVLKNIEHIRQKYINNNSTQKVINVIYSFLK